MYDVQCTVYDVPWIVNNVHCTVYTVSGIWDNIWRHEEDLIIVDSNLYTLYTIQCKVHPLFSVCVILSVHNTLCGQYEIQIVRCKPYNRYKLL